MLLGPHRETADGKVLRDGEHQRRTGRDLSDLVAAGCHDGDAVDVRAARLKLEIDPFGIVIAEVLRANFAELIAGEKPSELQIENRLGLAECLDGDEGSDG